MREWVSPFKPMEIIFYSSDTSPLSAEKWYQDVTEIMSVEHGSMERRLISHVIEQCSCHVDRCVRKEIPAKLPHRMTLDGHSSSEGY